MGSLCSSQQNNADDGSDAVQTKATSESKQNANATKSTTGSSTLPSAPVSGAQPDASTTSTVPYVSIYAEGLYQKDQSVWQDWETSLINAKIYNTALLCLIKVDENGNIYYNDNDAQSTLVSTQGGFNTEYYGANGKNCDLAAKIQNLYNNGIVNVSFCFGYGSYQDPNTGKFIQPDTWLHISNVIKGKVASCSKQQLLDNFAALYNATKANGFDSDCEEFNVWGDQLTQDDLKTAHSDIMTYLYDNCQLKNFSLSPWSRSTYSQFESTFTDILTKTNGKQLINMINVQIYGGGNADTWFNDLQSNKNKLGYGNYTDDMIKNMIVCGIQATSNDPGPIIDGNVKTPNEFLNNLKKYGTNANGSIIWTLAQLYGIDSSYVQQFGNVSEQFFAQKSKVRAQRNQLQESKEDDIADVVATTANTAPVSGAAPVAAVAPVGPIVSVYAEGLYQNEQSEWQDWETSLINAKNYNTALLCLIKVDPSGNIYFNNSGDKNTLVFTNGGFNKEYYGTNGKNCDLAAKIQNLYNNGIVNVSFCFGYGSYWNGSKTVYPDTWLHISNIIKGGVASCTKEQLLDNFAALYNATKANGFDSDCEEFGVWPKQATDADLNTAHSDIMTHLYNNCQLKNFSLSPWGGSDYSTFKGTFTNIVANAGGKQLINMINCQIYGGASVSTWFDDLKNNKDILGYGSYTDDMIKDMIVCGFNIQYSTPDSLKSEISSYTANANGAIIWTLVNAYDANKEYVAGYADVIKQAFS